MYRHPFASTLVRIQSERAHRVVSTGVYGLVRHPMYLGGLLMFVGGPLLTGAASALAAAVVLSPLLVMRILDEETLLAAELPTITTIAAAAAIASSPRLVISARTAIGVRSPCLPGIGDPLGRRAAKLKRATAPTRCLARGAPFRGRTPWKHAVING